MYRDMDLIHNFNSSCPGLDILEDGNTESGWPNVGMNYMQGIAVEDIRNMGIERSFVAFTFGRQFG